MRKIVCLIVLIFALGSPAFADEWNQDMFTDLVTYVYNYGEKIVLTDGSEFYNISLEPVYEDAEENFILRGHLGLYDFESYVVLIVEAMVTDDDGNTVVDHNFYTSYFIPERGAYCCLPNQITGSVIIKDENNIVKSMVSKTTQEFKIEGYENEEWLYWMGLFYEYMQTELSAGRGI